MVQIDYKDPRPIYEQIVSRLETLIARNVLAPDEKLPSVRQMAADLSINPNTIQKAYSILEREGYIYSVKGRGNFVSANQKLFLQKERSWLKECLEKAKVMGIDYQGCMEIVSEVYGKERT